MKFPCFVIHGHAGYNCLVLLVVVVDVVVVGIQPVEGPGWKAEQLSLTLGIYI